MQVINPRADYHKRDNYSSSPHFQKKPPRAQCDGFFRLRLTGNNNERRPRLLHRGNLKARMGFCFVFFFVFLRGEGERQKGKLANHFRCKSVKNKAGNL